MAVRKADRSQTGLFGEPVSEPVVDPLADFTKPGGKITAQYAVVGGIEIDLRPENVIGAYYEEGSPALCVVCGKHWLAGPKRTCYWCQKTRVDADGSAP